MKIKFVQTSLPTEGVVVVGVDKDKKLLPDAAHIDAQIGGFIGHYIASRQPKDTFDNPVILNAPKGLGDVSHIVLTGKEDDPVMLGGKIAAKVNGLKKETVTVLLREFLDDKAAADFSYGYKLRSWTFDKYLTKDDRKASVPQSLYIACDDSKEAQKLFEPLDALFEGVVLAREFASEPANVLYPESYANRVKEFEKYGLIIDIYDAKQLKEMGFNALVGVGQGSVNESRLIVLQWKGGKKDDAPLAIVGKGVTFDSGGISIKPSSKMEEMKWDMGGSAVVAGLMYALARNKVKANVVGVMGLVENMPSGSAQRPGDIVTSLSGQTVEVINTDAEGRLVLADALWYTQDRFKPKYMVDLATLTGAIIVALGHRYAGLFGNNEELIQQIKDASAKTKEKIWHLPMDAEWAKALKADQADLKNADYGVGAGSIMAAQFLECFVDKTPWAHIDIAGTTWSNKASHVFDKGATGFGVRLLYQWIEDQAAV